MEMAPNKSSDGETKDGYSGEMETSPDVASCLLGKRKVEFSSESEGDREVEKSDGEVEDSDFEWDKDSFDGVEYYSSDHSACLDEEFCRKCRNYDRAVVETKGFFEESDDFPAFLWAGIAPVPDLDGEYKDGITNREFIGNMVSECVDKFNKRNNKNLKYERVLRANFNPGGKTPYYATIAVRESDSPDAPLVEYQAKVVWFAGASYPVFCRPSPSSSPKTVEAARGRQGDGRD